MTATQERNLRPTISGHIDPLFHALRDRIQMGTPHYRPIRELEDVCIAAPGWGNMIGGPVDYPLPRTLSDALYALQRYAVDNEIVTQDELAEFYSEPSIA